jgi:hypothetical protein
VPVYVKVGGMGDKNNRDPALRFLVSIVILLLLVAMGLLMVWMGDQTYYCGKEEICNKPYLNSIIDLLK